MPDFTPPNEVLDAQRCHLDRLLLAPLARETGHA